MPWVFEDSTSRFVKSCNSVLLPAIRSISSANLRLLIFRPPIEIVEVYSSSVFIIICSRKMLNNTGGSRHPCLTPTVVLKKLPVTLLIRTALVELEYSDYIISMISCDITKLYILCHKPYTVKSLFKINKVVIYIFIIFYVLFHENSAIKDLFNCASGNLCNCAFLKPTCSSDWIVSACGFRWFRIILRSILLACGIRLRVR